MTRYRPKALLGQEHVSTPFSPRPYNPQTALVVTLFSAPCSCVETPLPGVCVSIQLKKSFPELKQWGFHRQRSPALSLIIQQWFQPVFPEGPNIIVGVLVNMTSCLSTPFLPRRSRDLGGKSTRYGVGIPALESGCAPAPAQWFSQQFGFIKHLYHALCPLLGRQLWTGEITTFVELQI